MNTFQLAARRLRGLLGAALASLALASPAWALKEVSVRESDSVVVPISIRDQTRIKVSYGRIIDVLGDVYDENKNPTGRITVLQHEDGDAYVKPVIWPAGTPAQPLGLPGQPNPASSLIQPIKLDFKTTMGTFGLVFQPIDAPGSTVDVRILGGTPRAQPDSPKLKGASHVRAIKAFTLALAAPGSPDAVGELTGREINREVALWQEAKFVHLRQHRGSGFIGDTYELTNVSGQRMVIDEREFFTDGVLAVSAHKLILQPGQKTAVWIVRSSSAE